MNGPVGGASDFTPIAARYDATRNIPHHIMSRCYDMLDEISAFPRGGSILDAGCGTGQMSIPLASRGFRITGIDISAEMARIASLKVEEAWTARYESGDVRSIAYGDGSFQGVVSSKLLMHVADWQGVCRELIRVTEPGSCIVEIKDRGFFGNAVRREFSRRADALGFKSRFPGVQPSSGSVAAFMASLGCRVRTAGGADLRWDHRVTPRDALDGFRDRLFAEFWYMPRPAYDRVLKETIDWAIKQPGGLDRPEHLTPYLDVDIYRTPAKTP